MAGPLTLSMKELDRLQVLTRIAERRLTRRRAAGLLQIGERQVRRLYRAFVQDGAAGLVSRRRGRPSARRLPAATQERALALIRERYADFGPTFAHQKLTEEHALVLSVETLRGWMSAAGLWVPRAQRARRSYPPRERRACLGELVQLDGSEHAWFEDRGPRCTLLVYVDDATSRLMELCFADTESTFDYFYATRRYLERHGKPMAFYSDRLSVFHVQARDRAQGGPGLSQFDRARERGRRRHGHHSRQRPRARVSPASPRSRAARARRRRRAQASRRRLRLDRGAATRPRRRTPRQPEGHAPRQEAASRRRVVLRVLSRSLIHATPDISTWGTGGHFYFVLTSPRPYVR